MSGRWEGREHLIQVQHRPSGDVFRVRYIDEAGTRRVSKTLPNITQARAERTRIENEKAEGTLLDVGAAQRKLSAVWDYFDANPVTKTGEPIKPSTMASYKVRWKTQIAPVLGTVKLAEITRAKVERLYNKVWRDADAKGRNGRDARRKVQQLVHRLLDLAVREGWLVRNPAAGIPMPGAKEKRPRLLTTAQVDAIAAKVPPRYKALVILLAESGLRVGEAVALRVKNLNGTIHVEESATEVVGKRTLGPPKTEQSIRDVPITPRLREELKRHYDGVDEKGRPWVNRFDPESLVFTTEAGYPIGQNNFRKRVFQKAAIAAKVRPAPRVHDLRHYWATTWLKTQTPSGERFSVFDIAKLGGWTDLKMLMQRYGHVQVEAAQELADRIFAAVTT